MLRLDPQNYTTPRDFFDRHAPCLRHISRPPYVPSADIAGTPFNKDQLQLISDRLGRLSIVDWPSAKLEHTMRELVLDIAGIDRANLGADDVKEEVKSVTNALGRYLRWALTGGRPGPAIKLVMVLLGQEVTLQRLREANAEVGSLNSTGGHEITTAG